MLRDVFVRPYQNLATTPPTDVSPQALAEWTQGHAKSARVAAAAELAKQTELAAAVQKILDHLGISA